MKVKTSFLSRILSGIGTNVTLETIAKCEDALDAEIIVCPAEYEERLIDNPKRLSLIVSTAVRTEFGEELIDILKANAIIRAAILASFLSPVTTHTSSEWKPKKSPHQNTEIKPVQQWETVIQQ